MRSRANAFAAVAAVLVLVPIAVGCGSDNGSSISKAEFLKKGNAICAKGNRQIDQAAQKTFTSKGKPSQATLTKFAKETLIPSVQSQIDGIKGLGAPKGDKDKVNAILTEAQAALDKGKRDPTLLVSEKQDPFAKANELAKAYGLTTCGSDQG